MKLERLKTKTFSQGDNIKADIKGGWCAGITAMVSVNVGGYDSELGMSAKEWVKDIAFKKVEATLDGINSKHDVTETLQNYLRQVKDKANICDNIHKEEFNGRGCKVLLSTSSWVPLFGYVSYLWQSKWLVNHVGYVVRGDDLILLFDPNYGAGLFSIQDNQPLTLGNLTQAIRELAWANSAAHYYLSSTAATAVIDEGAFRLRSTRDMEHKLEELVKFSENWA